jgi:hypothetical protein
LVADCGDRAPSSSTTDYAKIFALAWTPIMETLSMMRYRLPGSWVVWIRRAVIELGFPHDFYDTDMLKKFV